MEIKTSKIICFCLLLLFVSQAKALTIISDLDDTIKVTNTRDLKEASVNAMFSTKAYLGMPLLMEEMDKYSAGLYYVSASPRVLVNRIKRFFRKNEVRFDALYTRSLSQMGEKKQFKIAAIKKIISEVADEIILIGDDSQEDEEIYSEIKAQYPDLVKAVYIHNVYGEKPKSDAIRYVTALDIAVAEYEARRMSYRQVYKVAKALMGTRTTENIIPKFAFCPKSLSDFTKFPLSKASPLLLAVNSKVVTYCKLRPSVD